MNRSTRRVRLLCAVLALVAAAWLVHARAQEFQSGSRTIAQTISAPAIDRGVLNDGEIREPRRAGDAAARVPRRASDLPYVPGRVIVKFTDGGSATSRASEATRVGARTITQPSYANFDVLEIDPNADPEAVARELSARPDVEYAQAAYRVYPYFKPNDPYYSLQWNLTSIGMEQAWDINPGAKDSVVVAVLDTGIAFQNAVLQFTLDAFKYEGVNYPGMGRVSVPFAAAPELTTGSRFVAPYDFIWGDNLPEDMDGHGTHVAGTIGQLTNNNIGVAGMAFNVRLMPVKVISSDWDDIFDSPYVGTDDIVARGIRYAADNGAKVINMSIGRSAPPAAPVVGDAIRYAVSRGAFVAVAGGNDYERGNPVEAIADAAAPVQGAVVVGAVGRDLKRAYYSGVHDYVEIAAPGGNSRLSFSPNGVYQQTYDSTFTDPSRTRPPRFDVFVYASYQGTSMATPHVSGLAALLYSQGITNPAAIEAAMEQFATDAGATGKDSEYGYGLINPRATLRGLGLLK